MTKEEITLQLTLAILEMFDIRTSEYGGTSLTEHQEYLSEIAYTVYNNVYKNLSIKD